MIPYVLVAVVVPALFGVSERVLRGPKAKGRPGFMASFQNSTSPRRAMTSRVKSASPKPPTCPTGWPSACRPF